MTAHIRLLSSAKLISVLTLLSRILGLVRDTMAGAVFGAGWQMDAFTVGFQVPNLFRRLFGEGALSASSIPVLTDALHREGRAGVDRLGGKIMGNLLFVLAACTLAGELVLLALWPILPATAKNTLTLQLTAVSLPYMIPICAAAILAGIQNIFGQFAVPAMNPIILNVFMIAALIGGQKVWPGDCVVQAWLQTFSVLLSGVVQIVWQWHNARRCELRLRPAIDWRDPAINQIARTMLPMTLGLGVVQLNTLIGSVMAYGLVWSHEGGASVLYFAQRLYQFPLGVFAVAMATAIFPAMSRQVSAGASSEFAATYRRGIRVVLFEGLPCTVGLILIAEPIVKTLFERGNFDASDTARVVPTLIAYSAGIWAFGVSQIQVRALYALKDPHTPLRIATRMIALNLVANLALVLWMEEPGLALSTTLCAVVQVVWLARALKRSIGPIRSADLAVPIVRIVLATAVMAVAVLAVDGYLRGWDVYARRQALRLLGMTVTGGVAYVAAAWLLRCEELREILRGR